MEILFLYLWLEAIPAFDPCDTGTTHTCFALAARSAYTAQRVERFKSESDAMGWIKKYGKDGKLVDVQTGKEEYIRTKPIIKKVEKIVIVEETIGYAIAEFPDYITNVYGSITTAPLE